MNTPSGKNPPPCERWGKVEKPAIVSSLWLENQGFFPFSARLPPIAGNEARPPLFTKRNKSLQSSVAKPIASGLPCAGALESQA